MSDALLLPSSSQQKYCIWIAHVIDNNMTEASDFDSGVRWFVLNKQDIYRLAGLKIKDDSFVFSKMSVSNFQELELLCPFSIKTKHCNMQPPISNPLSHTPIFTCYFFYFILF